MMSRRVLLSIALSACRRFRRRGLETNGAVCRARSLGFDTASDFQNVPRRHGAYLPLAADRVNGWPGGTITYTSHPS